MNTKKNSKHLWIIPVYGIFYMLSFSFLENHVVDHREIIQSRLDDLIPFSEIFVIPYFLWFLYIAATVIYFALFQKNIKDYYHLIATLAIGMTLFLVISLLWPNGHTLRPRSFERDNIFVDMVRYLYTIDTPTNIFPSIHVFNSVACCIAIRSSSALKKTQNFTDLRIFADSLHCNGNRFPETAHNHRCYSCTGSEPDLLPANLQISVYTGIYKITGREKEEEDFSLRHFLSELEKDIN